MSKGVVKNKAKALKKENAFKKAKRKKIIIAVICALVIALITVLGVYSASQKYETEIYSYGGQTVQLLADGKFTANLSHNVQKSGTYAKTTGSSRTLVNFNVNGNIETGRIENNSLHLPAEWDDGHDHDTVFPRVN